MPRKKKKAEKAKNTTVDTANITSESNADRTTVSLHTYAAGEKLAKQSVSFTKNYPLLVQPGAKVEILSISDHAVLTNGTGHIVFLDCLTKFPVIITSSKNQLEIEVSPLGLAIDQVD